MKNISHVSAASYPFVAQSDFFSDVPIHEDRRGFALLKRSVDLVFALLALPTLVTLAVMIFIANTISNSGPVFFRQVRMGQNGKAFTIWKFRTMTADAAVVRSASAPLDEHRITPLGRLLRRTKLDEVPNILNIIAGDMSLVGPRPDAFEHASEYLLGVPHYRKRLSVRPGLTGLAQVRGGYADNPRAVQRKVKYDRFYIRNSSIYLDLYVIALTFGVVFSGFGQR
ncbi:MAG: sugar transferase [Sulfitobacter sp.]|mgnify:CR=1 FL=1|uniref:sugar transferase n=1 Tax=Sulfitobacter sp. TaxID=1903071 RepID=UPI0026B54382